MERQFGETYKTGIIVSGIILLLMLLLSGWTWTQIPAGQAIPVRHHLLFDTFDPLLGGRLDGLLLYPAVALMFAVVFAIQPFWEPRRLNFERSRKTYMVGWIGFMGLACIVHILRILAILGRNIVPTIIGPIVLGLFVMVIGNFLGKVRSNFTIGIKTQWTLSSDLSWSKTHRLAGRLVVLLGLAMVLLAVIGDLSLYRGLIIIGVGMMVPTVLVYSYLVWRAGPNKQTIGR